MPPKYFIYLAKCNNGSYYTGSTTNLNAREKKHNQGEGSKYTKKHLPIKIIYSEEFSTREQAVQREMQIKGWTRKKKENLIRYGYPNPLKMKCS